MSQSEVKPSDDPGDRESEEDKIIRVTTFHRLDGLVQVWGHDLDPQITYPYPCTPPPMFPQFLPKGPPTTGLGSLERFPIEIIHGILSQLTVRDTMRFRNVNRRGRQLVDNMVEYRTVTTHASSCFQAVFRTRISDTLRFADILRALYKQCCEKCDRAGEYIHLPTLTRCCLSCLHLDPGLRTVPLSHFTVIDYRTLRKLVRVVHGRPRDNWYVSGAARLSRRTNLIDYTTAKEVIERYKAITIDDDEPQSERPFAVSCPLPLFDRSTQTTYHALSCKGCALVRFMQKPALKNEEHTRASFLEHFQECDEAKRLWNASEGGTKDIGDLENHVIKQRCLPENYRFL